MPAGRAGFSQDGLGRRGPNGPIGPHTLALGVEAEASVGLLVRADADVTKRGTHGNFLLQEAP